MHVVKSISHKMKEGVHEVSLQRRVEMRNTSFLFKFLGSPKPVGEPLPICLFAQIPASQAHFLGKALLSSFPRNHFELFTFHVLQFYLITKHLHEFHYLTFITFREKWVFKLIQSLLHQLLLGYQLAVLANHLNRLCSEEEKFKC